MLAPPGCSCGTTRASRCTSARSGCRTWSTRRASLRARAASTATLSTRSTVSRLLCRRRTSMSPATASSGSSPSRRPATPRTTSAGWTGMGRSLPATLAACGWKVPDTSFRTHLHRTSTSRGGSERSTTSSTTSRSGSRLPISGWSRTWRRWPTTSSAPRTTCAYGRAASNGAWARRSSFAVHATITSWPKASSTRSGSLWPHLSRSRTRVWSATGGRSVSWPEPAGSVLDELVAHVRDLLGPNLRGMYVYGSLAFQCYNPARSDVDVLVLTRRRMAPETRRALSSLLHRLEELARLEISFLARGDLEPWRYPTPYDYHFSGSAEKHDGAGEYSATEIANVRVSGV